MEISTSYNFHLPQVYELILRWWLYHFEDSRSSAHSGVTDGDSHKGWHESAPDDLRDRTAMFPTTRGSWVCLLKISNHTSLHILVAVRRTFRRRTAGIKSRVLHGTFHLNLISSIEALIAGSRGVVYLITATANYLYLTLSIEISTHTVRNTCA